MEDAIAYAGELYKGYDIFQARGEWLVTINHPDGYDETGPFESKEAAKAWVDNQVNQREV